MPDENVTSVLGEPGAADNEPGQGAPEPGLETAPEGTPAAGDEALAEGPDALQQELRNLRSVIGRQGHELGELRPLRERVAELESRSAQQPQQPTQQAPTEDPAETRRKAIVPGYERRFNAEYPAALEQQFAIAEARAKADDVELTREDREAVEKKAQEYAARRAWTESEAVYDEGQAAEERAYRRVAKQFAPVLARQEAESTVHGLGIPGITPADVDAHLRENFGAGLDALSDGEPSQRQKFVRMAAEAIAFRRSKEKPVPTPVAQAHASGVTASGAASTASAGTKRAVSEGERQARANIERMGLTGESADRALNNALALMRRGG